MKESNTMISKVSAYTATATNTMLWLPLLLLFSGVCPGDAWTTTWPLAVIPQQQSSTALNYQNNADSQEPLPLMAEYLARRQTSPHSRVGQLVCQGKYVLTGLIPVASPKCEIYEAYPLSRATGQVERSMPLLVKFSHFDGSIDHEYLNYQRLCQVLTEEERKLFVQVYDYIPATSDFTSPWLPQRNSMTTPRAPTPAGMVMERGKDNLRAYIRNHGPYRGDALRRAMHTCIRAVHALHSHGRVWTECKPENFVVTSHGIIKAIDLESVIPTHALLQVYTAEACPPEFPDIEQMYQILPALNVPESFDIWGLGLVLFELAVGKPLYGSGITTLSQIQHKLLNIDTTLAQAFAKLRSPQLVDPQAASIIAACLSAHPHQRPTTTQLLQHDYFTSTTNGDASIQGSGGMSHHHETYSSRHFGMPFQSMEVATYTNNYNRQQQFGVAGGPCTAGPRRLSLVPSSETSEDPTSNSEDDNDDVLLCWKQQLSGVLEKLAGYAQEDPDMARDLMGILNQAQRKVGRRAGGGAVQLFR